MVGVMSLARLLRIVPCSAIDPDRPLSNVATMEQQLGGMVLQRATYVVVLGLFALTAIVLAAIGIVLIVLVALLAGALPVRRATAVNPTVALRCE